MTSEMEQIKPTVQLALEDVSIEEGKPLCLDCEISGLPKTNVIWYHNEVAIKESGDMKVQIEGDTCSLNIHEVQPVHAGNYKVMAINSAGEASSKCEVKVIPYTERRTEEDNCEDDIEKEKLCFAEFLETDCLEYDEMFGNQTAKVGETVKFEAVIRAEPNAWVEWYIKGKEITRNNDKFLISSTGNRYTLTIKEMSSETVGNVEIVARNRVGVSTVEAFLRLATTDGEDATNEHKIEELANDVDKVALADVEDQANGADGEYLEYEVRFDNQTAKAGETVKFEAVINAQPDVWVEWKFNGEEVNINNEKFVISSEGNRYSLTIKKMSSDMVGKVEIVASNRVGVSCGIAFLELEDSVEPTPEQ